MRSTGRVARLAQILLGLSLLCAGASPVMAQSASSPRMQMPPMPPPPPPRMNKPKTPPPPPDFGPPSPPPPCIDPGLVDPNSGAAGAGVGSGGGGRDAQDGGVCQPIDPPAQDANAVVGDAAHIGPAPFDLRALLQGPLTGLGVTTDPASEISGFLLGGILGERPNYGTSFAFGHWGTVGIRTGAFVHPLTLLELPSDVPSMGLMLAITYRSNGQGPPIAGMDEPFGPGFTLSGSDFLQVTSRDQNQRPSAVEIFRGDGIQGEYTNPFPIPPQGFLLFTSPQGLQDAVEWDPVNDEFTRYLYDGRVVHYRTVDQDYPDIYPRDTVEYLLAADHPKIDYDYDDQGGPLPSLTKITDTRGVIVNLAWNTLASGARRISNIWIDGSNIDTGGLGSNELRLYLGYDANDRLWVITYPTADFVQDDNGDGNIDLQTEFYPDFAPALSLGYDAAGLLNRVHDLYANETRLAVTYVDGRVDHIYEGSGQGTNPGPLHSFDYSVLQETTYTDPRGTTTTVEFDANDRVIQVSTVALFRPRTAEGASFGDHASLDWTVGYGTCGCSLPAYIQTPEESLYTFEWFFGGHLQSMTVYPDGTEQPRTYTLHQDYHLDPDDQHVISLAFLGYTDPLGTRWNFVPAYDATGALISVKRTTPDYTDANGVLHQPGYDTFSYFGSRGQLTAVVDGEQTRTEYHYNGSSGSGRYLLREVHRDVNGADLTTVYATDDLGRIHAVEEGPGSGRVTTYVSDAYGHNQEETLPPAGGGVPLVNRRYYDFRGNLTVLDLPNLDADGAVPAGARARIQHQWLHDLYGRVVIQSIDQASLSAASPDVLRTTFSYYDTHQLHKVTLPDGAINEHVVDGYGFLYKTIYDEGGLNFTPRSLFYDKQGHLIHMVQTKTVSGGSPIVATTDIVRDGFGLPKTIKDPETGQVTLEYDNGGRATHVRGQENAGGVTTDMTHTEFVYDELGQVTHRIRHVVQPGGGADDAKYLYNTRGQLTQVVLPYGRGASVTYDSAGRLQSVSDSFGTGSVGPGNTVTYSYENVTGRVSSITRSDVEAADFAVPPGVFMVKSQETDFAYDLLDRVIQTTIQVENNGTGSSVVHTSRYDSLGNLVSWKDTNEARIDSVFDGLGRTRSRTEIGVGGTLTNSVTTTTNYIWNATEHRVERKDGMATPRVTNYIYDRAGRLSKEQHPGYMAGFPRNQRVFEYDSVGRVEKITNGNSQVIRQYFDKANRLTGRAYENWTPPPPTEPWVGASSMALAEAFTYDALGRITSAETFQGGLMSLVKVTTEWDSLNRLLEEKFSYLTGQGGPPDQVVKSGYEFSGNDDYLYRRSLTYPSLDQSLGYQIAITPDGVGKLQRLDMDPPDPASGSTPSELLAQYRYAGSRPLERHMQYSTAVPWADENTLFHYDGQRRLDQMKVQWGQTGGPVDFWRWDFVLGGEGHLLDEKYYLGTTFDQAGSKRHNLSAYYTLNGTKLGVPEADFSGSYGSAAFEAAYGFDYDTGHNRISDTYNPGTGNISTTFYTVEAMSHRYLLVDGQEYVYDGEGNLRFDGVFRYKYDFKNRLSEVYAYSPPASGGGTAMAMTTGTGINKGKTTYLVDPAELDRLDEAVRKTWPTLAALTQAMQGAKGGAVSVTSGVQGDGSLTPIAVYGYDPYNRRVVRSVAADGKQYFYAYDGWREIEEISQPFGETTTQEERAFVWGAGLDELLVYARNVNDTWLEMHVHQDRMGSTHFVGGQLGWRYGPYGQVVSTPNNPPDIPYLWAGRRYDAETGLYYFRNRYYSPGLGRFLTEDPLGVWADLAHYGNPYAYAGNSPYVFFDPDGLQVRMQPGGTGGPPGSISCIGCHENPFLDPRQFPTGIAPFGASSGPWGGAGGGWPEFGEQLADTLSEIADWLLENGPSIAASEATGGLSDIGEAAWNRDGAGVMYGAAGAILPFVTGAMLRKCFGWADDVARSADVHPNRGHSAGLGLSLEEAIEEVKNGGSVFADGPDAARRIAESAGDGPPIWDPPHGPGQKPHYHPRIGGQRAGGHVMY